MEKKYRLKEQEEPTELVKDIINNIKSKLPPIEELLKLAKERGLKNNGKQISEEINRIKELFGNGFKPVIKEQRELILRKMFNLDLNIPAAAQVTKVGNYLKAIEQEQGIFTKYGADGTITYPYEYLGWRSANDFITDIQYSANPNLTTPERARAIEKTIRQLDVNDVAKFEAKVKEGAQDYLELELKTPESAFRTEINTSITEVLEAAVTRALELSPDLTKEELIVFVDIFYEKIKIELELDLGSDAGVFDNLPQEIKDNITDGKYPWFEEVYPPRGYIMTNPPIPFGVKSKNWWDKLPNAGDDDISFD